MLRQIQREQEAEVQAAQALQEDNILKVGLQLHACTCNQLHAFCKSHQESCRASMYGCFAAAS